MKILREVLKNQEVSKLIASSENCIGYMVQHLPILSQDAVIYSKKNKKDFISSDLITTKKKIKNFSKDLTLEFLTECSKIAALNIKEKEKTTLFDIYFKNLRNKLI